MGRLGDGRLKCSPEGLAFEPGRLGALLLEGLRGDYELVKNVVCINESSICSLR